MTERDVLPAVRAAESSPTYGDGHIHDFSRLYNQIQDMQAHNRGNGAQTQEDLRHMNAELHRDGILPDVDIVGVGTERHGRQEAHIIYTRDASGRVQAQYAEHVDDRGEGRAIPREMHGSTGQPSIEEREVQAALLGRMLGVDIRAWNLDPDRDSRR